MSLQDARGGAPAASTELIVQMEIGPAEPPAIAAAAAGRSEIQDILASAGLSLIPLFPSPGGPAAAAAAAQGAATTPSTFCAVPALPAHPEELRRRLADAKGIRAAYVKPPAYPPALPPTPTFISSQGYLDPAPGGVDARAAWAVPGGRGGNVRITDVEGDWQDTHEDLKASPSGGGFIGLLGGVVSPSWRDHGTAVAGVAVGLDNSFGIVGIAPDARMGGESIFRLTPGGSIVSMTAQAINDAATALRPGDVLLIELHRPGPRAGYVSNPAQYGYIAVEWWPDDFAAIQAAVSKGVIVVEAAGNGAENLSDTLYNTPAPGFPSGWANTFNRKKRDSGAILVGAGAPPSGAFGPDRSRLGFSNFGSAVDVQGWGREVVSTGYGDLFGLGSPDREYTATFSGTSSASPIVVGVAACLQGIRRAAGQPDLTPSQLRALLRANGSPQRSAPGRPVSERIGRRPNLRRLIAALPP